MMNEDYYVLLEEKMEDEYGYFNTHIHLL